MNGLTIHTAIERVNGFLFRIRSLAVFVILFIVLYVSKNMAPTYQTNDDPGLSLAFSGKLIFDEPTAVTAFSTKIWGVIETNLYKLVDHLGFSFEVHTWLVVIVLLLSFYLIISEVAIVNRNNLEIVLILEVLVIFIVLPFFTNLQFTMASAIATYSGAHLIIKSIDPINGKLFLGSLMMIIGYLMRPDSWLLVPILVFLIYVFTERSRAKVLKTTGKFIIVVGVIYGTVVFVDKVSLTKEESQFIEFNKFRVTINDYNVLDKSVADFRGEFIRKMGDEGISIFNQWYYSDKYLYNPNVDYGKLNKSLSWNTTVNKERIFRNMWGTLKSLTGQEIIHLVLLLVALAILLLLYGGNKSWYLFAKMVVLACIICLTVGILFKPIPFRLYFPIFIICILKVFTEGFRHNGLKPFHMVRGHVLIILVLLLSSYVAYNFINKRNWVYNKIDLPRYQDKFCIVSNSVIPFNHLDPYNISCSLDSFRIFCTGSFSVLPQAHKTFRNRKYVYITDLILSEPQSVWIILNNPDRNEFAFDLTSDFISAFEKFYNNKYQLKINLDRVKLDKDVNYAVYRIKQ